MKDFLTYFFGVGTEVEFANFSLAHFVPILLTILTIFLIYKNQDKIRDSKYEEKIRYFLAFALIISEMSYYWRLIAMPELNPNAIDHLPITVCGWIAIFCSYMLIGKNQTLFDVSYFWLFAGSIFALITPTVITYTGPTRFRFYQFWVEHTFTFISIFYMIFIHKMRPNIKSMIKAYAGLFVLAVIAYSANQMLGPGANYLFMAKPESTPSILDILPPNFALRLIIMASVITILFGVAYLPWYMKDKKQAKAST